MKKFLFAISILLAGTISVLADEVKYSSFYLSYSDKEYNVLIENDLGRYASVSFDVDNMEYGEYALVKIYINKIDQFIKSLEQAKSKYIEWSAIAKDSGRVCFMKKFPYPFNIFKQDVYFTCQGHYYGKSGLGFHAFFNVDAEGNPYLILRSDEASDSNVVYQSSTIGFWGMSMSVGTETLSVKGRTRGVQLVFASEEEIDDFISVIVQAKLHREDIETIKDLFK